MILRLIGATITWAGLAVIAGSVIWYFVHYPGEEPRLQKIRADCRGVAFLGFFIMLLGFWLVYLGRV